MPGPPSSDDQDVQDALAHWFDGELPRITGLGEGHINSTWRVHAPRGDFVLQRISQSVFPNPPGIDTNFEKLFSVVELESEFPYELPRPLAARTGETLVRTASSGNYWRLSRYFDATRTLQSVASDAQAQAAGLAFGRFQQLTRAIKPESLIPVIDGFQRLDLYWDALQRSVERAESLDDTEAALVAELSQHSQLPQEAAKSFADANQIKRSCVIHGDCKVNNLLFAPHTDAVVAVLDLDTLMVGPWWLDFGDLVRSAAYNEGGEFSRDFYAAVVQGFFAGRGELCAEEFDEALRAPAHLSFMLSVRFLEDHLQGDRYFRVSRRGDNLTRARSQFQQYLQLCDDACRRFMEDTLRAASPTLDSHRQS